MLAEIAIASTVGFEQLLRSRCSEFGPYQSLNTRRWFEGWVEDQKIAAAALPDFQPNDRQGVTCRHQHLARPRANRPPSRQHRTLMLEVNRRQRSLAHLSCRRNGTVNEVLLYIIIDLFIHWPMIGIIECAGFTAIRAVLARNHRPKRASNTQYRGLLARSEPAHLQRCIPMAWLVVLTSGVPMYFRVPRMPPVSTLPAVLMPRSHALSISSCRSRTDGNLPGKSS